MGEALGAVIQLLSRLANRRCKRCLTAFGLWCARQFRGTVMRGLYRLFDRRLLETCFRELATRLRREEDELCRVALLGWMDFVARTHGGELYRQFRELLPDALGLRRPDGSVRINCREGLICNEPKLCLKAYLFCKEEWMEEKLRSLAAGTPYAEVVRVLLGEGDIPEECGGRSENCAIKC
ncbi:MAG: hypothetical protein ACO2PM_00150 [Pyrobaculum sp.]